MKFLKIKVIMRIFKVKSLVRILTKISTVKSLVSILTKIFTVKSRVRWTPIISSRLLRFFYNGENKGECIICNLPSISKRSIKHYKQCNLFCQVVNCLGD